jgi:hypothetical protein
LSCLSGHPAAPTNIFNLTPPKHIALYLV